MRELNDASAAIAAHSAFPPVAIEIYHFKIIAGCILQVYQAIAAYTEPAVAESFDQFCISSGQAETTIIYHDKIISGTLVFAKWHVHDG